MTTMDEQRTIEKGGDVVGSPATTTTTRQKQQHRSRRSLPTRTFMFLGILFAIMAVRNMRFGALTSVTSDIAMILSETNDGPNGTTSTVSSLFFSPVEPTPDVDSQEQQQQQENENMPKRSAGQYVIPLQLLTTGQEDGSNGVKSDDETNCQGTWMSNHVVVVDDATTTSTETDSPPSIPKIIHQAAPNRCVSNLPFPNVWWTKSQPQLEGYAYYFHDTQAQDWLLLQDWPEFPHLSAVAACIKPSRQALVDLWRWLVLWEYGGFVVDWDVSPGNAAVSVLTTTNMTELDAILVQQKVVPPPRRNNVYFLPTLSMVAVSPQHPLSYYAVQHLLYNIVKRRSMWANDNDEQQRAPDEFWKAITGDAPFQAAFAAFNRDMKVGIPHKGGWKADVYQGRYNRSITLLSSPKAPLLTNKPGWREQVYGPDQRKENIKYNGTCLSLAYDFAVGPVSTSDAYDAARKRRRRRQRRRLLQVVQQ